MLNLPNPILFHIVVSVPCFDFVASCSHGELQIHMSYRSTGDGIAIHTMIVGILCHLCEFGLDEKDSCDAPRKHQHQMPNHLQC